MDRPEIHYARSGNVYIGYQAFGDGPLDLVIVPGGLSNIVYGWALESWQNFYGTLASFARVLLFDKRGTGISDPVPGAPSVEERMDDVRAVMDAAGCERAALMGALDGAAMAALFAATYPERTAALVLNNPVLRGSWVSDYPWGSRDEGESAASLADWWVDPTQSGSTSRQPCRGGLATRSSSDKWRPTCSFARVRRPSQR